jgi:hypothetical protein
VFWFFRFFHNLAGENAMWYLFTNKEGRQVAVFAANQKEAILRFEKAENTTNEDYQWGLKDGVYNTLEDLEVLNPRTNSLRILL